MKQWGLQVIRSVNITLVVFMCQTLFQVFYRYNFILFIQFKSFFFNFQLQFTFTIDWCISLSIIPSGSVHVVAKGRFHSFYGQVIYHCVLWFIPFQKRLSSFEKTFEFFFKLNIHLYCEPTILFPGVYSRKLRV